MNAGPRKDAARRSAVQGIELIVLSRRGKVRHDSTGDRITTDDEVTVFKPSKDDRANFVQQELAALGIDLSELRRQARERDFQSTAAGELWVMIGDARS